MIYVCLAIQTHTDTADWLETEAGRVGVGHLSENVLVKAKNWLVSSSQREQNME